jgi:hypothetical protein
MGQGAGEEKIPWDGIGREERFHGSKKIPRWDEVQETGFVARRRFQVGTRYRREVLWLGEDFKGWDEGQERGYMARRRF